MDLDLAQSAVSYALSGKWKEAIVSNKQILKENPRDIDALNRLARAYAETGDIKKAKTHAQKVLKIDPFNRIAQKAVKKWESIRNLNKEVLKRNNGSLNRTFLEEPGKTTISTLLFPGDVGVIATLDCGDEVYMATNNHRVNIETSEGKYIGRLADDLSSRVRKLIYHGNEYRMYIKSLEDTNVKVFIREIKRSDKLTDIPSFTAEKIEYASFTPPELVHKKDAVVDNLVEEED